MHYQKIFLFAILLSTYMYAEVKFNDEKHGADNLDFLLTTKKIIRPALFVDQESNYKDRDFLTNYKNGDEVIILLLAAQSGVLDDTLKLVNEVARQVSDKDLVMSLGRTPLLFMMLWQIAHPGKKSVLIPFTGTPDTLNLRRKTTDNDDAKRNMITPENLITFHEILKPHLDSLQGKLFIVDAISTGASLNSFLRILRKLYPQHLKNTNLVALSLNPIMSIGPKQIIDGKEKILFQYGAKSKKVSLPTLAEIGTRSLVVDTIALLPNPRTILMNDNSVVKHFFAPFAPFPACNWTKEYVSEHIQNQESPFYKRHKIIINKLRQMFLLCQFDNKTFKEATQNIKQVDANFITQNESKIQELWDLGGKL